MLLDNFFSLVNKWHPEYTQTISSARIFELNFETVVKSEQEIKKRRDNYAEYCFLPFQSILITYDDLPVIVLISDPEADIRGFYVKRNVIIFMPYEIFNNKFKQIAMSQDDNLDSIDIINSRENLNPVYLLFAGAMVPNINNTELMLKYHSGSLFTSDTIIRDVRGRSDYQLVYKMFIGSAPIFMNWLYNQILLMNNHDRFIVEIISDTSLSNDGIVSGQNSNIADKHNEFNSKFIIMKPDEIRKTIGLSKGNKGSKKSPHERRRHFRTMRSPYYVNKQGQTITIHATWIGETEMRKGDKIYKVRIDI